MPFKTISDLPGPVQEHLPQHAREIYLPAFNNAWNEYEKPGKRKTGEAREEVSHKVAWAAVKKKYVKKGDKWVTRQEKGD